MKKSLKTFLKTTKKKSTFSYPMTRKMSKIQMEFSMYVLMRTAERHWRHGEFHLSIWRQDGEGLAKEDNERKLDVKQQRNTHVQHSTIRPYSGVPLKYD